MQWRKLATLIVLVAVVVGASAAWSAWRRRTRPPVPVFVPGAVDLRGPR